MSSYYTLLSRFLNTHLGRVIAVEEREEGDFLIQSDLFCFVLPFFFYILLTKAFLCVCMQCFIILQSEFFYRK